MISEIILKRITTLISNAIREDDGDHALVCIPKLWQGKASKRQWHHSGVEFAKMIILLIPNTKFINDGDVVQLGDVVFHVSHTILKQSAWF
jgi:hypothetical protein